MSSNIPRVVVRKPATQPLYTTTTTTRRHRRLPKRCMVYNSLPAFGPNTALQLGLATVAAYLAAAWPDRPRGWSRTDLLEVRESPIEGRGVFATADIPPQTVVGTFPGRPRPPQEMAAKCIIAPKAKLYCFKNKLERFLDPTDAVGEPSKYPSPGVMWPLPVDPTLAFVNEPPQGVGGTNVTVQDDPNDDDGLIFVSILPISAGKELFVDYGSTYDRSGYISGQ